jgi:YYY domain-containing protein
MIAFILWYISLTAVHWLAFPLAYRLFHALPDRGYALSRTLGLLIWGYVFWLFASFGIAQNDVGGILLALALLAVLSAWAFVDQRTMLFEFIRANRAVVITTEILFLLAFAFMAFVRSANPELASTEKPMELAFISAIMHSPSFPPQDPWLSGYAISYYYFGYVMTAMLARLTGIPSSMAHNLMTSLVFALGSAGSFGVLYNLLARARQTQGFSVLQTSTSALLAPLFLLLVSNFGALLEVLHRYGIFWTRDPATGQLTSSFWTWLDMKELSSPPVEPFGWEPERYLWWWRSSRILQDYDMLMNPLEVIDEFPFFSFLLGDLHPHVLAIPFSLLAMAVGLHIFLGGWRGKISLLGMNLYIKPEGFFLAALVLGGLAFLNTWDILVAAALIVLAYVFACAREDGWRWARLEDMFILGIPLGFCAVLLYLPFYFGFSSQAGGIYPSLMYPSRGAHLWAMWGTLLIPILAYLLYLWLGMRIPSNWKLGFSLGVGFVLLLWVASWIMGIIGYYYETDFVNMLLASQQMDVPTFFRETSLRRLKYIGGLITMLAVLIPSLAFLFSESQLPAAERDSSETGNRGSTIHFVLLLTTLGTILIIAPDFAYLRDQFGYRINTVFKFYYQAWILLSMVASFGVAFVLQNLQGWRDWVFRSLIAVVVFCGLLYPSLSLMTKTNDFKPIGGFTLDDLDRMRRENPDEAAAIEWLRTAPRGVVAEAVGDGYSSYARISTYSGQQTVLGWPGHEAQWRGTFEPQGTRREDITRLYATTRWEEALQILEQYDVRYVYVGTLERISIGLNEEKFISYLRPVFQQGNVVIYEVPQN